MIYNLNNEVIMKVQTYRSLLTGNKTLLSIDNGKPYGKGRLEAHIRCSNGKFYYAITDGFDYITINSGGNTNLKSVLNIAQGRITNVIYPREL